MAREEFGMCAKFRTLFISIQLYVDLFEFVGVTMNDGVLLYETNLNV